MTDYPDQALLDNMLHNRQLNLTLDICAKVEVKVRSRYNHILPWARIISCRDMYGVLRSSHSYPLLPSTTLALKTHTTLSFCLISYSTTPKYLL